MTEPSVDPEALLVALVLAPATFSRNRFFSMYSDPGARRVRRRAALLRNLVRQVAAGAHRAALLPSERGGALLTYQVPSLGLKRTAALDALELSVLRFAVARGTPIQQAEHGDTSGPAGAAAMVAPALPQELLLDPADASRIERALARLLPDWDCPAAPGPVHEEAGGSHAATEPLPCAHEQGGTQAT